MIFALTQEQQERMQAMRKEPAQVVDPRTRRRYVLLPLEDYEMLKDQGDQSNLRTSAARTLGRRLAEGE
jgi:hypothetical protein